MVKPMGIYEICYMIKRLNSCKLLTGKVDEKVPWTTYKPDEKNLKSTGELEMNFPQRTKL